MRATEAFSQSPQNSETDRVYGSISARYVAELKGVIFLTNFGAPLAQKGAPPGSKTLFQRRRRKLPDEIYKERMDGSLARGWFGDAHGAQRPCDRRIETE